MMNPFKEVNWNPGPHERRKFGRSLVVGFPVVAMILLVIGWIRTHTWQVFPVRLGIAGAAFGLLFWAVPRFARPFYLLWYFVACCLGFVTGNVLLTVFFYFFLTPLGLLRRRFRGSPIKTGFNKKALTYWQDAEKTVDLKSYYRQF